MWFPQRARNAQSNVFNSFDGCLNYSYAILKAKCQAFVIGEETDSFGKWKIFYIYSIFYINLTIIFSIIFLVK